MPAIETDGLTRRFGDLTAVDALNLTVEDGEVFGFLGPNGAGKSTTINMLLGFLQPSEGSATVLGHDAASQSRAVRQRTGLLPEGFELYENLTGREHVVSAVETKNADDDPDELIERVGLDAEAARRRAGGYSKGMTQRLALAVALVGEPDLLILDEPSSGLDPKGAKLLREIVRKEADRGATVFFSSHILGQVEAVCDRVGILADGQLVAVDTVEGLREAVGASSTLELTMAEEPSPDVVGGEGVGDVSVRGNRLRVTCTHPRTKARVIADLVDDGHEVVDVGSESASLEDLFAVYTEGEATPVDRSGSEDADRHEPTGVVS